VNLSAHKRDWDELAAADPLWAVLTDPSRTGGRWEPAEFLATGEEEIAAALATVETLGRPAARAAALDFGCGAGRLTRALARRFGRAVGVDIAAGMVAAARRLNGDVPNAEFLVNDAPDLRIFADGAFDLVYSSLVLQHLPGRDAIASALAELARVTAPDGLLVVQLPSSTGALRRLQLARRGFLLLRSLGLPASVLLRRTPLTPMRMLSLPEEEVRRVLAGAGARVLRVDALPGSPPSCRYYAAPSER
jgi:SAM-dependent methyltransferase